MESFTAADIDGGYAAVTPLVYIGRPPFPATFTDTPQEAVWYVERGETVWLLDSDSIYETLILLGMPSQAAFDRLSMARFGPLLAE